MAVLPSRSIPRLRRPARLGVGLALLAATAVGPRLLAAQSSAVGSGPAFSADTMAGPDTTTGPSVIRLRDAYVTGPLALRGEITPAAYRALRDSLWKATRSRDAATAYRLGRSLVAAWPLDPDVWGRLGLAAEGTGHPREALEAYGRAFALGTAFQPFVAMRAARVAAGLGERDTTLEWIRRALAARYEERSNLQTMKAFEGLRSDPTFRALAGFPPDTTRDRDARWRYDIGYMVEEARRLHASPGRQAYSPAFSEAAAALADSVSRLTDDQILLGLQRVVALLGDGHSVVYGTREGEPPNAAADLPVVFYQFDDGLFIVDADSSHRELIGSRVVSFGGVPAGQVLERLAPFVNRDNAMTVRWLGVRFYMRNPGWLHAVGAAPSADRAELTVRALGGGEKRVVLRPGRANLPRKLRWPWRYEKAADGGTAADSAREAAASHGSPPLWLQDANTPYWMRWLPERRVLYVQFNQVRDEKGHPLSAFASELRAQLDSTGTRALVVDVRRNNGGNNGLLEPLLRTLTWFDQDRPGNRIFVLTSRNTFSAAQDFVNRVDRRTDAVFVGEPSASRPDFTGEDTHVVLPYSRAVLSISSRYWQDSDPGDERPWVAPDMPVGLTSEAYFSGQDPALEAVFGAVDGVGGRGEGS